MTLAELREWATQGPTHDRNDEICDAILALFARLKAARDEEREACDTAMREWGITDYVREHVMMSVAVAAKNRAAIRAGEG